MVQQFREREVQVSGQLAGYQNVNYSPDSFGAQVGRALSGLGDTMQQTGKMVAELESKKKANDTLDIFNKASDEARPLQFDPEFGVFAQNGGNAMGSGATVSAGLENIKQKYLGQIEDPETKTAFERLWLKKTESIKDAVARHEMTQLGSYAAQTAKASLLGGMQDAYNYYNDDSKIGQAIDDAVTAIRANQAGLPENAVAAAEAEAKSQIHLAVISRWAAEDPDTALDYYTAHKDELDGKDHVTATQFVSAARDNRRAMENVARITGTGGAGSNWLWNNLIQAESAGDPNARSPKNAAGLAQIIPSTARYVAKQQGLTVFDNMNDEEVISELQRNTVLNENLGKTYLNEQLNRYKGDVEAALVAYNAGPDAADAFLKHNAGRAPGQRDYDVPGWKGVKNESEAYVKKILGGATTQIRAGQRMTRDNFNLKNFRPEDIFAPTAGGQWVDARAATALDNLAGIMSQRFPGFKVKINEESSGDPNQPTAGRRRGTSDPKDNPHVKNSQHIHGTAFDVQVQGWPDEQKAAFLTEARKLGFSGIGFYGPGGHLHIDMGAERTWGSMPDWARGPMGTPVTRGAGGETVTSDWRQSQQPQNFFQPGANMGSDSGFFVDPKASALDAWLAQAQLISDPGERERTIAMLRVMDANQTQAAATEAAAVKQTAWDFMVQGGSVSQMTPDMLSRLDPSFVNTLSAFESNRAKGGPETDWQAYYTATRMPAEELVRADLYTEYRNKLADAEFQKLMTLQAEAQKSLEGKTHDAALLANTRTRSQILDDIAAEQGWNMKQDSGKQKVAQLNRALDTRIMGEQALKGKELSADEIQDIADKLLIQDKYDSWGPDFRGNALTTDAPEEFVAATEWTEVQPDDQKLLIDTYERQYGTLPTDGAATDLYNRAMRVWLGAKPSGPDEESIPLREALQTRLRRTLTDSEFEKLYGKFLLSFLGR